MCNIKGFVLTKYLKCKYLKTFNSSVSLMTYYSSESAITGKFEIDMDRCSNRFACTEAKGKHEELSFLTLMLLVANLTNTKRCKKPKRK